MFTASERERVRSEGGTERGKEGEREEGRKTRRGEREREKKNQVNDRKQNTTYTKRRLNTEYDLTGE